jgi:hypothetical protein
MKVVVMFSVKGFQDERARRARANPSIEKGLPCVPDSDASAFDGIKQRLALRRFPNQIPGNEHPSWA